MTITKTDSRKFFFISGALIALLDCFYVFQIVKLTESNYLIGQKENQVKELKKETSQLELAVSRDRSLSNFEEKVAAQGFEKITDINYIVASTASLASAK